MTNVEALKQLAAVVCGVDATAVTGYTIPEVIKYIADNYPKCTVTFSATPSSATIVVKDAQGNTVTAGEGGTYTLAAGSYTYTASNEGYTTKSNQALTISTSDVATGTKSVTVTLEAAGEG